MTNRRESAAKSCAQACVHGRPVGERHRILTLSPRCSYGRRISSTARRIGSAFMTIPAPPPYGTSSATLCLSCVYSRKLWTLTSSRPFSRARLSMLLSRTGVTISGNSVMTSHRSMSGLDQSFNEPHRHSSLGDVYDSNKLFDRGNQHFTAFLLDDKDGMGGQFPN